MLILNIFSKMHRSIRHKVDTQEPGLYVSLAFPIAIAFLITFVTARMISYLVPWLGVFIGDFRIHHYTWGIFVLAVSGYLALVFDRPRAKYLISLLHGFGLGLAFDEFATYRLGQTRSKNAQKVMAFWLKMSPCNFGLVLLYL